jgi:hypothetical protein
VRRGNKLYGLCYDHRWQAWSAAVPDADDCIRFHLLASSVRADPLVALLFCIKVPVDVVDECTWRIEGKLPHGYKFKAGWAKAGDTSVGGCFPAQAERRLITFTTE